MLETDFLSGVVEGFYGRPWSQEQRLHLFGEMAAFGLNTYFYAPKYDLKHRAVWRQPYDDSELMSLCELVQACEQNGLNFIYGLSPGLDIRFSDQADVDHIQSRFEQLRKLGVRHFALLFDDLPLQMGDAGRRAGQSLAAAHCEVTNAVYDWAREQSAASRFLFCPTPYCERMDGAALGGVRYLDEVGQLLQPEIDVLWTGPEIVSQEITVESVERITARIGRRPVIWDNIFANDYDMRRLFCGPYSGRPRELRRAVGGILINPNNEYPINFIPLRTFARFLAGEGPWQPREAFLKAVSEWLPYFETVNQPLAPEDLVLLADCFYLPHEDGSQAARLLALIDRLLAESIDAWGESYEEFSVMNARIQALFDRLTELRDRELFDAWSRRIWALKEELLVIEAALAAKRAGRELAGGMEVDHYLPGTFRGGILAKLERLLSIDAEGKIRPRAIA